MPMFNTAAASPDNVPPLLFPDEPPPFERIAGGNPSVLFACDHASARIPRALGTLGLEERDRRHHIAWDIGAAEVARLLAARFDAPCVLARYSRLAIDLNRAPHDPTLIPAISDRTIIPGNRDLAANDIQRRIDALFRPYHQVLGEAMGELCRQTPAPALIAVHSFTPVFKDEQRPWHFGVLWDGRDGRIAEPLLKNLQAQPDLCVGDNEPYSGLDRYAFTVDHHARRHGFPHVGIETRQDLIEDKAGAARFAAILGDALAPILSDPALCIVQK